MKELIVCVFWIYCMVFLRVSNGQSIQLEYLSDQCNTPETMLFKVTLNTTNATDATMPYTIELYAYFWRVCEINISSEGCFNGRWSSFSYCVQQDEDNFIISIAVSTSQNFFDDYYYYYYYYYYYFASSYCIWRGPNYIWSSNIVRIPLFFQEFGYKGNNIYFDFKYSFVGKSSPAMINTTSIEFYYWNFYQDANISFVIGTEIINFNNSFHRTEFQLNVSKQYDIDVFDEDVNCSYVCDSLDVSVGSLDFQYAEEGNLTNLTFSIPATHALIFSYIYFSVIEDQESFYVTDSTSLYDTILREYSMSFRANMDWSSHLAFHVVYAYNTTFCRANEQNVQIAIPKAVISPECPSGPAVKNGHIRRGTTATCKCQIVRQSRPAGYVQWFTEDGQSVSSPGEISDLTLPSNTTGSNTSYNCYGISENGQVSGGTFVAKFYDEPKVKNFTVNGLKLVSVNVNSSVTFYCKVEADPQGITVLTGSGLGKVQENTSASDVLELTLNDLQCEDSGRYFCSGLNGFEDNATSSREYVDVNIICAPKLKNVPNKIPSIQVSPNQNTVFTLEVYGYPEPTDFGLKIETGRSTSAVNKDNYSVKYLPLIPPFGLVTLTIYDANTKGTTTYILSVKSEAGEVEMKLEVVKYEQPNIEAKENANKAFTIGVSVVCGVLALGTIIAVAVHLRRLNENR